MNRHVFSLIFVAVAFSACTKQEPVAVVDGYSDRTASAGGYSEPVNAADRAFDLQSEAILLSQKEERYYVHGGDKLDQISKHFGVKEAAILARNGITDGGDLPEGQYIVIPSPNWQAENSRIIEKTNYRLTDKYRAEKSFAELEKPVLVKEKLVEVKPNKPVWLPTKKYARQHVLKAGENIYRIALKYNVSQFDILKLNNIKDPSDLKPGMVLKIPGEKAYTQPVKPIVSPLAQKAPNKPLVLNVQPRKMRPNGEVAKAPVKAVVKSSGDRYAELAKQYSRKKTTRKGMIWPASGKVIKTFGHKGRGVSHSGINIAMKKDAPIYAADSGTVIYSDNGLELYGNLILVRHKGGYVTAYAHNAKNIVKRNQKVKKGDLIGFAGQTGNVEKTQLHFEVRKNAQPINPMKLLPRK